MEFPTYSDSERSVKAPLDTYIADLADFTYDQDQYKTALDPTCNFPRAVDRLRDASAHIGRACIDLLHGDRRKDYDADDTLLTAITQGRSLYNSRDRIVRQQVPFMVTAGSMIRARNNPFMVDLLRKTLHLQVTDELRTAYAAMTTSNYNHNQRTQTNLDLHGTVSELTATALLTRLAHPQLLAAPAMPHQDYILGGKDGGHGNDIIIVESGASKHSEAAVHRIQVKSNCLELCDRLPHSTDPTQFKAAISRQTAAIFGRYNQDTVLVSACCDLDERFSRTYRSGRRLKFASPLTEKLLAEANGSASASDIRDLDTFTNQLLLSVTGDERRRGSFVAAGDAQNMASSQAIGEYQSAC